VGSASQAVIVDFDVQSEFDSQFTVSGTSGSVSWSNAAGVAGASGRVDTPLTTGQNASMWYDSAFDLDDGPMTASILFRGIAYSDTSASRIIVGLVDDFSDPVTSNLRDNPLVQARIIKGAAQLGRLEIRNDGVAYPTDIPLVTDHWYRLSMTVAKSAMPDGFDMTASLEDWGVNGTDTPISIRTISNTRVYAPFYTGTDVKPLYVGFLGQNSGGGTDAFDDFTTTIPEPGALTLSAIGAMMLLVRRRR
jgi:hypothetical protein